MCVITMQQKVRETKVTAAPKPPQLWKKNKKQEKIKYAFLALCHLLLRSTVADIV